MIKEASLQDLNMMFLNTLIRFKENPVYVEHIMIEKRTKKVKIELYHLTTNTFSIEEFNEEDFNFKPVRLGYVNHRGMAVYIYRQPYRKFKQGLHNECMNYVESEGLVYPAQEHLHRKNNIVSQVLSLQVAPLCDTFSDKYPSLKEAIIKLENGDIEVAFDRQFSICYKKSIRYKGKIVGEYSEREGIIFNKGFEFLKDAIRKDYEV